MNFVNLTPHVINVIHDGKVIKGRVVMTLKPSGVVARVDTKQVVVGCINGINVVKTEFVDVVDLPNPLPETVYVVSTLVLQALKEKGIYRNDVVAPDTSSESVVRDSKGNIVGVKRFQVL